MESLADPHWLWLENSALAEAIRQRIWFYPMIETIHILGLAVLFGSVAMFDLRLLGISRQLPVTDMARHILPWTYFSFLIVMLSGFLLFAVEATQIAVNPAFRLKLILLTMAAINAALFHGGIYKSVRLWNREIRTPIAARITAILSLVLWVLVIVCGRLIAYV